MNAASPENVVLDGSQSPTFAFTTAKIVYSLAVQAVQHNGLVVLVKFGFLYRMSDVNIFSPLLRR